MEKGRRREKRGEGSRNFSPPSVVSMPLLFKIRCPTGYRSRPGLLPELFEKHYFQDQPQRNVRIDCGRIIKTGKT